MKQFVFRRPLTVLLALLMAVSAATVCTADASAAGYGDIDDDDLINATDALLALQSSVELVTLTAEQSERADVDDDSLVNAADALLILQRSVGLIDRFEAECDVQPAMRLTVAANNTDSALVKAVADFQQQHTDVRVQIVPADLGRLTSLDELQRQIKQDATNVPDVVLMDSADAVAAGRKGYLLDLRQFGAEDVKDRFLSNCWSALQPRFAEEGQYGLPFNASILLQFYNKELLSRAGVSTAPSDWEEMTLALEKLKALPEVTSPLNLRLNPDGYSYEPTGSVWLTYLWRMGGEVFNQDGTAVAFDGPEGVEALQFYADLIERYGASAESWSQNAFLNGTVGFTMMDSQKLSLCEESNSEFAASLLPVLKEGVPPYSGAQLCAVVLPNKLYGLEKAPDFLANAQLAYEFAEFYAATLEYQQTYCESTQTISSLRLAEESGKFKENCWTTAYEQLRISKFRDGVDCWDSIETYLVEAINNAVNNILTPQEALRDAAVMSNRQLAAMS